MKSAKENGVVQIMMDGKYIKTESTKGLTEDQVAAKIRAGLGGKEYNQLRMDAMYDLKQRGVEQGHAEVVGYYTNLKQYSETILLESQQQLRDAQAAYDKAPTESARQDLEAVRGPLEEARVQVEVANKNLTQVSDPANFNPNQYVNLFTDKFIANQSNAYAYQQTEAKIQGDPYGVIDANSKKAMNLASYNSQLRMQEFEAKSEIIKTKLPNDARVLSGADNFVLDFRDKAGNSITPTMGLNQLAEQYKETGINITSKGKTTTSTVGKEVTEANAAFTSADIKTDAGRKAIQDAINKLNTSFKITSNVELKNAANKASAILQAYKTYQSRLESFTRDGEFIEVNFGTGSIPADEFFSEPFSSQMTSQGTKIYSRPRRSMNEMEQVQAMKGNNSSTPVPAPVESGDPDID
jgi:hypothetical protein